MRSLVVKSCPSHERSLRNFCAKSRATEKLPTITMSKKRVEMKELRILERQHFYLKIFLFISKK